MRGGPSSHVGKLSAFINSTYSLNRYNQLLLQWNSVKTLFKGPGVEIVKAS